MPAGTAVLEKLRALITHDGTPASERQVALERLERLLRSHDGPSTIATRVTRSARIGRQRRTLPVDERDRLAAYVDGLSFGACIGHIVHACGDSGPLPTQIDFGYYGSDQPVVAVRFLREAAPRAVDFATAIDGTLPGTQVNLANRSGPEERLFLLYLPCRCGAENAAR